MVDVGLTYLLWALGFMFTPCPGLHRLYMRKFNAGTVLRFIPGIGHILALVDLVLIPSQVREINLRAEYERALGHRSVGTGYGTGSVSVPRKEKESIELVILKTAKKNHGIVSPGEVALEGHFGIEEAKSALDGLAKKGYSELQVKKSGVVVYTFPEFMDEETQDKFVEF